MEDKQPDYPLELDPYKPTEKIGEPTNNFPGEADGGVENNPKYKRINQPTDYEIPTKGDREVTPPAYINHGGPRLTEITPGADAQTPGSIDGEPSAMGWGYLGGSVKSKPVEEADLQYSQFLKSAFPLLEFLKSVDADKSSAKEILSAKYAFLFEHKPWLSAVRNLFLDKIYGQEINKTAAVSLEDLKYGIPEKDVTRLATRELFVAGAVISGLSPDTVGKVVSVSPDYTYAKIAWALGSASIATTALSSLLILSASAAAPYKSYFSTSPTLLKLSDNITLMQKEGDSNAPVKVIKTKPGDKVPEIVKAPDGTTEKKIGEAQQ